MVRIPEISMSQLAEIGEELNIQRLVQPHVLPDILNNLRGRLLAGKHHGRISGKHAGQNKRDQNYADQRR
ncbi:hypothetical protein D3C73_1524990 [compost metagenome]